MKKTFATLLAFLGVATFLVAASPRSRGSSQEKQKAPVSDASFVYEEVKPRILRESTVPPRLPSFLPYVDREHPIYVVLRSVNKSGYEVVLAMELPCEGEHRCTYGTLLGSTSPLDPIDTDKNGVPIPGAPVTLDHGIKGHYFPSVAYAYPSDAYVRWQERPYYYSVSMKAGRKSQVVRMANSAIAAGHAKPPARP